MFKRALRYFFLSCNAPINMVRFCAPRLEPESFVVSKLLRVETSEYWNKYGAAVSKCECMTNHVCLGGKHPSSILEKGLSVSILGTAHTVDFQQRKKVSTCCKKRKLQQNLYSLLLTGHTYIPFTFRLEHTMTFW
jgi:hypothetical protein